MQLAQQLLLLRLLVAGLTSSSVPPVGPDGSCAAFRPLPEPTSLAAADAASGVHPYVLRRRYIDAAAASGSESAGSSPPCDRLSLESNEQLLELLNASAAVSDLAAYAEAGSALGSGCRPRWHRPSSDRPRGSGSTTRRLCSCARRRRDGASAA